MPRGAETIVVHPIAEKDWQGDPVGAAAAAYSLTGCVIWPVYKPDTNELVPNSLDVYIPSGTLKPRDRVEAREHDDWNVDGGTEGQYINKGGRDKGRIVRLKRLAAMDDS